MNLKNCESVNEKQNSKAVVCKDSEIRKPKPASNDSPGAALINPRLQSGAITGGDAETVSTVSRLVGKPFKRFSFIPPLLITSLKRGINESTANRAQEHSVVSDPPSAPLEKLLRLAALGLALLCLAATSLHACGPYFPNNLLNGGDGAVLSAPVADFVRELERLKLAPSRFLAVSTTNTYEQETFEAEMADLATALKKAKVSPSDAEPIIEAHRANRKKLNEFVEAHGMWEAQAWRDNDENVANRRGAEPEFPEFANVPGLPGEFADYFDGVVALRHPDMLTEESRAPWERLLQRPAAERKYKSTWAAFMLGKSWDGEDDDKAVEYFQQTRTLAKQRFADSIGLAVAAVGLEARIELRQKHFEKAIKLYLEQYAAGDNSAVISLRWAARAALDEGADELAALAANANTRSLITAYLISGQRHSDEGWNDSPITNSSAAWLAAVEEAEVKDVDSAERLALAAYQAGEFEIAQRWANRARSSAVAQWIQAKLLLRAGKLQQGAALLAKVAAQLPVLPATELTNSTEFADSLRMSSWGFEEDADSAREQVLGELGVLRLSRREFTPALDALLNAGFWEDAAYVAERVLTTDELKDYVDRFWPLIPEAPRASSTNEDADVKSSIISPCENIRYLLARRLTRELRGDLARSYYPTEWQPQFDELAAALLAGWDENQPPAQRAKALFQAARIARHHGMGLLGTELGPDWHIWDGNFEEGVSWGSRAANREEAKINLASTNEIQRASSHTTDPGRRFHYRYQAAFLGWEAAKLMPNDSDETALVLWTAGTWLKARDPETADIFYKALVRRCRRTELGAAADLKRWFPELDADGKVIQGIKLEDSEPGTAPDEPGAMAEFREESPQSDQANAPDPSDSSDKAAYMLPPTLYQCIIHSGDTLMAIVRAYNAAGVNVSLQDVLDANQGIEPTRLSVGQIIFVPAPKE